MNTAKGEKAKDVKLKRAIFTAGTSLNACLPLVTTGSFPPNDFI
jgi:hypothetical protein